MNGTEEKRDKLYIEIKGRISLNKWNDKADPTLENNQCFTLTNYIPNYNSISTREGITEFSFS